MDDKKVVFATKTATLAIAVANRNGRIVRDVTVPVDQPEGIEYELNNGTWVNRLMQAVAQHTDTMAAAGVWEAGMVTWYPGHSVQFVKIEWPKGFAKDLEAAQSERIILIKARDIQAENDATKKTQLDAE